MNGNGGGLARSLAGDGSLLSLSRAAARPIPILRTRGTFTRRESACCLLKKRRACVYYALLLEQAELGSRARESRAPLRNERILCMCTAFAFGHKWSQWAKMLQICAPVGWMWSNDSPPTACSRAAEFVCAGEEQDAIS